MQSGVASWTWTNTLGPVGPAHDFFMKLVKLRALGVMKQHENTTQSNHEGKKKSLFVEVGIDKSWLLC